MADSEDIHELHAEAMRALLEQVAKQAREAPLSEGVRHLAQAYATLAGERPKRASRLS